MKSAYSVLDENNLRTTFIFIYYYLIFALLGLAIYFLLDKNIYIVLSLFILAILYNIFFLFKGDKITTFLFRAKEINKQDNPEIYNLVENVSITAGLPKTPKIYLIDTDEMNAFAYGTSYKNYLICLTTGLIKNLEKKELEAVIAHEISHIKNKDTRTMTIAIFLAGVIYLISDIIIRVLERNSSQDRNNKNGKLYLLLGIFFILAPIFATIITFAISRKREFAADASAALLTRDPLALASALRKIASYDKHLFKSESFQASLVYTPLFIVDPNKKPSQPSPQNFHYNQKIKKKEKWGLKELYEFVEWLILFSLCILAPIIILISDKNYLILGILIGMFISAFISSKLYDTHPPVEERIEILEKMVS